MRGADVEPELLVADKAVAQYSRGMKGRLTLARSLLCNPELLFLDEPAGGLDPSNSRRVMDLIRAERAAGRTVFLTTHDMLLAEGLCDRVAFIADGRIACIDSPFALKLRYGERTVRVGYRAGDTTQYESFPLTGLAENQAFLRLLRDHEVHTVHSQEATLSDVFIRVTGRVLA